MKKFLSKHKKGFSGLSLDHPAHQQTPPHFKPAKHSSLLSTAIILLLAPAVAFFLITFVFQSYQVDGPSMETTLNNNDRLIINKLPRTWAKITGHAFVPKRSDIIIFTKHNLDQYENSNGDKNIIKRVIGLPGERVVVKDNKLLIYNGENPKGFEPDKFYPYGANIASTPGNIDLTIPENEVFVCGDNRVNSLDSRTFGSVPVKDIVGRLSFRLFPLSDAKKF
ncbi:MAG TPA: signal peptidase I [Candidatus Saccharimonadales bacterium]|nr:signal peptidase I [Candidatus Saccharimonadales bacterium]